MKILIVEDNESLAKALKIAFKKRGHIANYILDGKEGEEGIRYFYKKYDAIILDLMLPGRNGFEIYRNIRRDKIPIPVIMLTGRSSDEDRSRAFGMGIDYYITKPFSFKELLKWVETAVSKSKLYNNLNV